MSDHLVGPSRGLSLGIDEFPAQARLKCSVSIEIVARRTTAQIHSDFGQIGETNLKLARKPPAAAVISCSAERVCSPCRLRCRPPPIRTPVHWLNSILHHNFRRSIWLAIVSCGKPFIDQSRGLTGDGFLGRFNRSASGGVALLNCREKRCKRLSRKHIRSLGISGRCPKNPPKHRQRVPVTLASGLLARQLVVLGSGGHVRTLFRLPGITASQLSRFRRGFGRLRRGQLLLQHGVRTGCDHWSRPGDIRARPEIRRPYARWPRTKVAY